MRRLINDILLAFGLCFAATVMPLVVIRDYPSMNFVMVFFHIAGFAVLLATALLLFKFIRRPLLSHAVGILPGFTIILYILWRIKGIPLAPFIDILTWQSGFYWMVTQFIVPNLGIIVYRFINRRNLLHEIDRFY